MRRITFFQNKGFTLVELLIAVSILALLAAVGVTIYNKVAVDSRDAKRKADIDAIAKAYETKFDPNSSKYDQIYITDFVEGIIPTPPEGGEYQRSAFGADNKASSFRVCAKLDAAPSSVTTCPVSGQPTYCYCKQSSQNRYEE